MASCLLSSSSSHLIDLLFFILVYNFSSTFLPNSTISPQNLKCHVRSAFLDTCDLYGFRYKGIKAMGVNTVSMDSTKLMKPVIKFL